MTWKSCSLKPVNAEDKTVKGGTPWLGFAFPSALLQRKKAQKKEKPRASRPTGRTDNPFEAVQTLIGNPGHIQSLEEVRDGKDGGLMHQAQLQMWATLWHSKVRIPGATGCEQPHKALWQ